MIINNAVVRCIILQERNYVSLVTDRQQSAATLQSGTVC